MSVFSGIPSCVSLSVRIVDLLLTSKNNKHEYRSLQSAVDNIKEFLIALPQEGVTQQGNKVLRQLHAQLLQVYDLLGKVSAMGPLVSLLKAHIVREDFLRTNRDLLDTFGILARGEQLLRGVAVGAALQDQGKLLAEITRDLKSCRSEFFIEEQTAQTRLLDVAAAGKERVWTEELLQNRLLKELKALPQVSGLDDDGLLSEFRALQMLALYNGPAGTDNNSTLQNDMTSAEQGKKCKHVDKDLEEFLLQQVCAALAASVAATSSQPLQAGPESPSDYLCPISQQIMINPVMLFETGHSYEAANIIRWLDMHSTCPLTGQKLHSKQLGSNRTLKNVISDWVAAHGIVLPAPPTYYSVLDCEPSPATMLAASSSNVAAATLAEAAARLSIPHTVLSVPQLEVGNSMSRDSPFADQQQQQQAGSFNDHGKDAASLGGGLAPSCRAGSKQRMLHCSRTRWAVALVTLVVVLGVGIGAGVGVATKQSKATTASGPSSAPVLVRGGPDAGGTVTPEQPTGPAKDPCAQAPCAAVANSTGQCRQDPTTGSLGFNCPCVAPFSWNRTTGKCAGDNGAPTPSPSTTSQSTSNGTNSSTPVGGVDGHASPSPSLVAGLPVPVPSSPSPKSNSIPTISSPSPSTNVTVTSPSPSPGPSPTPPKTGPTANTTASPTSPTPASPTPASPSPSTPSAVGTGKNGTSTPLSLLNATMAVPPSANKTVGCSSDHPHLTGGTWNCTLPLRPGQACDGMCDGTANFTGTLAATCGPGGLWNVTSGCAYRVAKVGNVNYTQLQYDARCPYGSYITRYRGYVDSHNVIALGPLECSDGSMLLTTAVSSTWQSRAIPGLGLPKDAVAFVQPPTGSFAEGCPGFSVEYGQAICKLDFTACGALGGVLGKNRWFYVSQIAKLSCPAGMQVAGVFGNSRFDWGGVANLGLYCV